MSGKLGSSAPLADSNTLIYEVPVGKVSTVNISAVNRGAEEVAVKLAITTSASTTPDNADYLEYDAKIPANGGVLERTAVVCSAGEKVVFRASTADCSVRVHGFEEDV